MEGTRTDGAQVYSDPGMVAQAGNVLYNSSVCVFFKGVGSIGSGQLQFTLG